MELKRVLIVEDGPDIQMLSEIALRDVGHMEVQIANDGVEALAILRSWQPDLVLMDVMMPNMTGPEALTAIQNNPDTQHIPVVFMTAKSEREELSEYLAMGAKHVIMKPFDPMELAEEVTRIYLNLDTPE